MTITEPENHFIDLAGERFHYLSWGTEQRERPGVLLLHQALHSAQDWLKVGSALANRYRVYALDMRGHGESVKSPAGTYNLRQLADDVAAFLRALQLDRPAIIGHSLGGTTALILVSGTGSRQPVPALSHVILVDPAWDFRPQQTQAQAEMVLQYINTPSGDWQRESPSNENAQATGKNTFEKLSQASFAVANILRESSQFGNLLPLLAHLPVPGLLVRADPALFSILNDTAWQEAERSLAHSPHSQAIQIKGAAHDSVPGNEEFLQEVGAFLRR